MKHEDLLQLAQLASPTNKSQTVGKTKRLAQAQMKAVQTYGAQPRMLKNLGAGPNFLSSPPVYAELSGLPSVINRAKDYERDLLSK